MTPEQQKKQKARAEIRRIFVEGNVTINGALTELFNTDHGRELVRDAYGMTEETEYAFEDGEAMYWPGEGEPPTHKRTVWRGEWRGVETT